MRLAAVLLILSIWLPAVVGASENIRDPLDYFLASDESDLEVSKTSEVWRIQRDFNNDGLVDIALAESALCGKTNCLFTLYIKNKGGTFSEIGEIALVPRQYSLVPLDSGRSRLTGCMNSGKGSAEPYGYIIDSRSVNELSDGDLPSEFNVSKDSERAEYKALCQSRPEAPYFEACKLNEYLTKKRCDWRAVSI